MSVRKSAAQIVEESESSLVAVAPWWQRVRLDEVAQVLNGAPFDSKKFNTQGVGLPLIRIRDVGADGTSTFYAGEYDPVHMVHAGDLLVGMDGDFRAARWRAEPGLLNQRVCKVSIRDSAVYDEHFLALCLQPYLDEICKVTSSVTVKHLSSRTVAEIPLPLPPREEQRRVAAEVERRLSHIDAAERSVATAARRLALARAAVLEAVGNGSLLGFDAAGWEQVAAGDVTDVRGGIQKQPKRKPVENKYPFLRVANVGRGTLDLAEVHEVELFNDELATYQLRCGDLLVVEGNGSVDQIGRAAMWDGAIADCVHQNHLIRVRPGERILPEFLALVWNSPSITAQLVEVASSTSGLHTLSTGKVKAVKLALPAPDEQQQLVDEANRRLSLLDAAARSVTASRRRCRQLRRSVLAAAFRGELVAQDPDDEPADVLLQRIRDQRTAAGQSKAVRKTAKTAVRTSRTKKGPAV